MEMKQKKKILTPFRYYVVNYVRRNGENCVSGPQLRLEYVDFTRNAFDKEINKGNVRNLCFQVLEFFQ